MFRKKEKEQVCLLYTTSTRGSMYRHGSKNKTLYFEVFPDEEEYNNNPLYHEYFNEILNNELYTGIVHKFIISQPLLVKNDKLPFMIFKSNIDDRDLMAFVQAIVQELDFHTGIRHKAVAGLTKTMFIDMNKSLPFSAGSTNQEKISRSSLLEQLKQSVVYQGDPQDNGIMTPFDAWKADKLRRSAANEIESEEIVQW